MKIGHLGNIIYEHDINNEMHPNQHIFSIYTSDKSDKIGTLVCHKSEIPLRPNYEGSVLAIDFLEVKNKNQGLGTKILKFAEEFSKQINCKGYLILKADGSYSPKKIPHIFYRKYGFSTFDRKIDKKLDKFIRKKLNATNKDFPCLLMYYPPKSKKRLQLVLKLIKILQKTFR